MSIAKRNVSIRNFAACQIRLADRHSRIRQARATNNLEVIELNCKPSSRLEMIRKRMKTLKLTPLGALTVAGMQRRDFVILGSDGCCDTAVHPTAHQNHGLRSIKILVHYASRWSAKISDSNRVSERMSKGQTPRT